MALPGETIGIGGTCCPFCGKSLEPCICHSAAGWYIGYFCCGPVSRETGYYLNLAAARADLARVLGGLAPLNGRT